MSCFFCAVAEVVLFHTYGLNVCLEGLYPELKRLQTTCQLFQAISSYVVSLNGCTVIVRLLFLGAGINTPLRSAL